MQDDDNFQDDELEEIADQIQVGDRTEGAQALNKLIERAGSRRDIGAEVRRVQRQDTVNAEIQTALKGFADRYPTILQDELLADSGMTVIRREIEKDLKELGADDEALKPIRGSTATMLRAYTEMRMAGRGRAADEIFGVVGEEMRTRYNIRPVSGRTPQQVIREARAARGFANDEGHVAPVRSARAPSDAEQKRQDAARAHMEQRRARYDNVRNGIRSQNPDAY